MVNIFIKGGGNMKTNLTFESNFNVIGSMDGNKSNFEVLEYKRLNGSKDISTAASLYFMKEANLKLRQIKISLGGGAVKLEAGALSYLRGNIEMENRAGGLWGIGKKYLPVNLWEKPFLSRSTRVRGRFYK